MRIPITKIQSLNIKIYSRYQSTVLIFIIFGFLKLRIVNPVIKFTKFHTSYCNIVRHNKITRK